MRPFAKRLSTPAATRALASDSVGRAAIRAGPAVGCSAAASGSRPSGIIACKAMSSGSALPASRRPRLATTRASAARTPAWTSAGSSDSPRTPAACPGSVSRVPRGKPRMRGFDRNWRYRPPVRMSAPAAPARERPPAIRETSAQPIACSSSALAVPEAAATRAATVRADLASASSTPGMAPTRPPSTSQTVHVTARPGVASERRPGRAHCAKMLAMVAARGSAATCAGSRFSKPPPCPLAASTMVWATGPASIDAHTMGTEARTSLSRQGNMTKAGAAAPSPGTNRAAVPGSRTHRHSWRMV